MGLRFKKSINIIKFIINLSKNKFEYKVEKMANDGNKTTYSLPENIQQNKNLAKSQNQELPKKEKKYFDNEINKEYKLPTIDLIKDDDSKNYKEYYKRIKNSKGICIPIGKNKDDYIIENISSMPNMLIGGTVMSGKTSYINTIILSILLTKKPSEIKLMIFDYKGVDYAVYNGISYLLLPIISDYKRLNNILQLIIEEIKRRTNILKNNNIKNISQYNKNIKNDSDIIPDILLIIDSLTSLDDNEKIDEYIEFITSNGWNVNVYMIVATNYPTSKIISTLSKSNFPVRMSFKVTDSKVSKIIINESGAEKLSELGTALYSSRISGNLIKIKVPYISDNDIERIVNYVKTKQFLSDLNYEKENKNSIDYEYSDPLYNEVVEFAISTGKISVSLIQRRFKLGYNRASRLIDILEENGIVGSQKGALPREVLIKSKKNSE